VFRDDRDPHRLGTARCRAPADRNKDEDAPVGTIPIDAVFSPIRKVNYTVTNALPTDVLNPDLSVGPLQHRSRRHRRLPSVTSVLSVVTSLW